MSVHTSASCRHFVTTRRSTSKGYNNNNNNNNNSHKWRFDIQQTRTLRCSLRQCTVHKTCTYVWRLSPHPVSHNHQQVLHLGTAERTYMLIHNNIQTNPGSSNGPLILSLVPYSMFRGERWTIHAICMFYQFLSHLKTPSTQPAGKLKLKSDNRSDSATRNQVT